MLTPIGSMRRVAKQNEPKPVVAGLLRRIFTKNKYLNSTNLHEFVQRDYPAPHCERPRERGGSRPRDAQVISRAVQDVVDSIATLFGIEKDSS